jgi:hypothetical protein
MSGGATTHPSKESGTTAITRRVTIAHRAIRTLLVVKKLDNMEQQTFYVLRDLGGIYRPLRFITPVDAAGEFRRHDFEKNLEEGEEIVKVSFNFIHD